MPELKGPERYYSRARLLTPLLATLSTVWGGSILAQQPPAAPNIVDFDKIAHFHVYGLIGTLLFRSLPARFESRWRFVLAWVGTALAGCCDESIQAFNPVRSADAFDLLADVSGALIAIALYRYWRRYRALLETRLWGKRKTNGEG